ncbi:membrane protein [[Pantoea] beijingensis]|uniref:Membrane protein n=1 Tax=[Pantoea] beijingensis TaxID=1324864 RepID=A0A443IHD7_9GAMM|nr:MULTISPECIES: stress-induced protein YchH [Bacteria]MCH5465817.1 stress-induced protein YchH [Levilactobacillus tujiorum]RWR03449.1 membrane protein [[Pantoea] beijingensis]
MKRRHANVAGNILMGFGLLTMVAGVGYSVLNQLPQLQLPQYMAHGAIFSIFLGALLWLVGARISGREKIADRYYWLRHCGDQRCRRQSHHHHS